MYYLSCHKATLGGQYLIISISQMSKLRHQEVKQPAQGNRGSSGYPFTHKLNPLFKVLKISLVTVYDNLGIIPLFHPPEVKLKGIYMLMFP